ncbi:MAG: tetratricopeptide repeat protein, partial [Desulfobacteraceae bacterium]
ALQQLGRPEQALKALQRSAPNTKSPNLLMLKADLLYNLERYAEAARTYRQTAKTDTKQKGRAWLMAGYAALQASDVDAGRRAFKQAATFERQRRAALLAIGRLPKIQQKPSVKRPSS